MKNVRVTYQGTEIKEEKINFLQNEVFEFKYYAYFDPLLTDINIDSESAFFKVLFTSQLEGDTLYYRLATISTFEFDRFVVHEDRYEILKDYSDFSFRKHLELLEEKLRPNLYNEVNQQYYIVRNSQGVLNPIEALLHTGSLKLQ